MLTDLLQVLKARFVINFALACVPTPRPHSNGSDQSKSPAEAIEAERVEAEAGNLKAARKLQVRIQEKFTFPMACVVFGLIGSSLGSRPGSRTSRSQGFGISILLILGYYALSFSFSSLGVKGVLPALLAAWLPVLISLGAGTLLLRQASR